MGHLAIADIFASGVIEWRCRGQDCHQKDGAPLATLVTKATMVIHLRPVATMVRVWIRVRISTIVANGTSVAISHWHSFHHCSHCNQWHHW